MIHFPGESSVSGSSVLNELQLSDRLFIKTRKALKVVEPTENKCMGKFFRNPADT